MVLRKWVTSPEPAPAVILLARDAGHASSRPLALDPLRCGLFSLAPGTGDALWKWQEECKWSAVGIEIKCVAPLSAFDA